MHASLPRRASAKSFGYHRIRDSRMAERIVASTGLAPPDRVIEFGGGDGQLTAAVADRCRRITTIETDRELWRALKARFAEEPQVEAVLADFMAYSLPARGDYKLISNVPFGLTAALLRRVSSMTNPPAEAFFILQLEAAQKWAGLGHETLASILLKTRFEAEPLLPLHRSAFAPRPNVDCMLVGLVRRPRPLMPRAEMPRFEAFLRRSFGGPTSRSAGHARGARAANPSELTVEDWVRLFRRI